MAALPRCLCLVLAMLTAGWRPSAFVKTRSTDSCVCRDSASQLRPPSQPDRPICDYSVLGELFLPYSEANPASRSNNTGCRRFKLKFPKMDTQFVPVHYAIQPESFQNCTSLIQLLNGLSTCEVFLGFYLEQEESDVWTLARETITVHRWSAVIRSRDKSEAVSSADHGEPEESSDRFYPNRFTELKMEETCQETWLVPAVHCANCNSALLVTERGGGQVERSRAEFFEDDPRSAAVGRPCGRAGQNRRVPRSRRFLLQQSGLGI